MAEMIVRLQGTRSRLRRRREMFMLGVGHGARLSMSYFRSLPRAVAFIRYAITPNRISTAHFDLPDAPLYPWGSRWRKVATPRGVQRRCTTCRSMHPMDLIAMLDGRVRWNPTAAHIEMMHLMQRGEVERTWANYFRWQRVPDDAFMLRVVYPGTTSCALSVALDSADRVDYSVALLHISDLPDVDREHFRVFLSEHVPEYELLDDDDYGCYGVYHPDLDPMLTIPEPTLVIHDGHLCEEDDVCHAHGGADDDEVDEEDQFFADEYPDSTEE